MGPELVQNIPLLLAIGLCVGVCQSPRIGTGEVQSMSNERCEREHIKPTFLVDLFGITREV